nr:hypothetical protein [Chitinophagaceae bacterium]
MKQIALPKKSSIHFLPLNVFSSKKRVHYLVATFLALANIMNVCQGQIIQVFDFNAPSNVHNVGIGGYDKPGVGSYHARTNGGTATFNAVNPACFGYTNGAGTSSSLFIFRSTGTVNSIEINAFSSSSNRTLTGFATSNTLNGTYNNTPFTTSGTIGSNECGTIICTPTTPVAPGTFMRFTFSGNFTAVVSLRINVVPIGTAPTVSTNTVTAGINTANINGTVNAGLPIPSMPIDNYGVIWHTANTGITVSLPTKTVVTPPNMNTFPGNFTNQATGLIPNGTQYYARAYVRALDGNVYYGAILPFTTLAATLPVITTTPAYNVLSNKATSGGINIDSGGLTILQKGVCWSTTPNPTTALATKTSQGAFAANFTSLINSLDPSTTYYVRAYAVNAVGTGYGQEISFTTGAAVPIISATPLLLNFGDIPFGSSIGIMSYNLSGKYLTPLSGLVTASAPTGYQISLTSNANFSNNISIPYSNGTITNRTIYVKATANSYGTFNGFIPHIGGGTIPLNTDTVVLNGKVIQDPNVLTNAGTDFWLGFGYQSNMETKATDEDVAQLSIYVAATEQSATIVVDIPKMPGVSVHPWNFPRTITIPANSVVEVKNFPIGDSANATNPTGKPDTRLYFTGITNRGIHVYSTNGAPIAVW